jgi:hypothetical protein
VEALAAPKDFTGMIEDFCTFDAVSPGQFHEMWNVTPGRSAEFMLALAVLEQAIEDLHRYRDGTGRRQRLYRQAWLWITSNDRCWPFSFVNVCEMLDLPCGPMRLELLTERPNELRRRDDKADIGGPRHASRDRVA